MLTEHWDRCRHRALRLGVLLHRDAFVFSLAPDGSTHLVPMSVSQRYGRLAARLGLDTHLHSLRHYSATELIASGVDVRTVAGRLGHSGGGITTLRVYAAWLAEADQRAAGSLIARLPARPEPVVDPVAAVLLCPRTPREKLAVELHDSIVRGDLEEGDFLPGIKLLAAERGLSTSTVQRAFVLLREWGVVEGEAGERPRVAVARGVAIGQTSAIDTTEEPMRWAPVCSVRVSPRWLAGWSGGWLLDLRDLCCRARCTGRGLRDLR